MNKQIRTAELFECRVKHLLPLFESCEYPWEILPKITPLAWELCEGGLEGYTLISEGVLVGENVKIYPNTVIEPPCVIGSGTQIRPGAFLRGGVIVGERCVIGNSCELKNCILLDCVQVPHYNYVGDSILGNDAHLGAGAVCSNLKNDGKSVVVHADADHDTGLRKVGGILGDGANIGCGSVINPGTVVGKNTSAYPLTSLRGTYPPNCIIKSTAEVVERA